MDLPIYITLFFKGILVGFIIAVPIGPTAILCIKRSLSGRHILGLLTGLGAGLADTVYGTIAAFSLAGIADFIEEYNFYLRLFGGILVAWIGVSIFRAPLRSNDNGSKENETLLHGFTSAFFLTLSNPITLLVFAAAFAAIGVGPLEDSFVQASILVLGVFTGASGWWLMLVTSVTLMHHKISDAQLLWINRSSGVMLVGFALYILLSLV
ncbi:MAG: LysE family transporter [Alphaproteobacteria bacterium]|nr:LysE family transporter [Alphaproteobacteria bacterium]